MINIKFITTEGCVQCARAKKIFKEVESMYPEMKVAEIDAITPEGMELVSKYHIFSSPGIIINDELFSMGGVNKKKLIEKLNESK